MTRLNLLLLLAVLASALYLVNLQYESRRLFSALDKAHGEARRLETDREVHDAYGRTLAYVYVGRVMVNAALVRAGMAESFAFAPNTTHKDLFDDLEADARTAGRGQWGPLEGGPPYGVP